jgi:hypothetical protein
MARLIAGDVVAALPAGIADVAITVATLLQGEYSSDGQAVKSFPSPVQALCFVSRRPDAQAKLLSVVVVPECLYEAEHADRPPRGRRR